MKYPESFVARVKEVFPDHLDIEMCLQNNSSILGSILNDSQKRFTAAQIIEALENGRANELLVQARAAQRITDLYHEWGELQLQEIKIPSLRERR